MLVSELMAHPDQRHETRRFRYGHVLGPALSSSAIAEWQRRHPQTVLGTDVVALLNTIDGIHLWADLDIGRGHFGILPLAEWCAAREHYALCVFEDLTATTLVISYHDDGDYYLLLHTAENRFSWFDPQSPSHSTSIDGPTDHVLGWWWLRAQELNPAKRSKKCAP